MKLKFLSRELLNNRSFLSMHDWNSRGLNSYSIETCRDRRTAERPRNLNSRYLRSCISHQTAHFAAWIPVLCVCLCCLSTESHNHTTRRFITAFTTCFAAKHVKNEEQVDFFTHFDMLGHATCMLSKGESSPWKSILTRLTDAHEFLSRPPSLSQKSGNYRHSDSTKIFAYLPLLHNESSPSALIQFFSVSKGQHRRVFVVPRKDCVHQI